jgi:hypothetical protein
MKVLVIGGMHGNEPLGPQLVELFTAKPVPGVDVVLANEQAITKDCRFVKSDINRLFPGDASSDDYEIRRASEILTLTKKYDVVLDFHNTHCPDNDCGFVGQSAGQRMYDVSSWLGLGRIVVADYDCINKYASNCLSVEISLDSPAMDVAQWYRKIVQLSEMEELPRSNNVETFRFAYRMTLEDEAKFNLTDCQLRAFEPIEADLAESMGVSSPAYPIFIGDKYTPYNYGGLLNRL